MKDDVFIYERFMSSHGEDVLAFYVSFIYVFAFDVSLIYVFIYEIFMSSHGRGVFAFDVSFIYVNS